MSDAPKTAEAQRMAAGVGSHSFRHNTGPDLRGMFEAMEKAKADRAEKYPTEQDALLGMFEAFQRLFELGWRDARFCPKDGSVFDAIAPGCSGIHDCFYLVELGGFWGPEAGDLWPMSPILFREKAKP